MRAAVTVEQALRFGPVALLELLARAARAWVVASDLVSRDARSISVCRSGCSYRTSLIQLPLFSALELLLEGIDGG